MMRGRWLVWTGTALVPLLLLAEGGVGGSRPHGAADAASGGRNLIPNAALSSSGGTTDAPAGWSFEAWGGNTSRGRRLGSPGVPGGSGLRVEVTRYRDGDARWSFDRVPLAGDTWYAYRDLHRSDGRSRLILSCREPNSGAIRHFNLWQSHASDVWGPESVRFYLGPSAGCEATIFHLVDRDGFLETALPILTAVAPRPLRRPLVSLAFDDGYRSAVTTARADLDARGLVGSFYLVRGFIEDPGGGHASEADLRALVAGGAAKGHEIGSHTARHLPLTTLPPRRLRAELRKNLDWLSSLGIDRPGLAYPFGDFDGPVEAEVRRLHPYARGSFDGLNDATVDRYRIKTLAVTSATETSSILASIDDAVRTSTWLVLTFHDIGEPAPSHPYRTSRDQFLEVLDRLAVGDAAVVTVAGALAEIAR